MPLKVSFVQSNAVFGKVKNNVGEVLALAERVGGDLIVAPELCNTGYAFPSKEEAFRLSEPVPDGNTTRAFLDASQRLHCTFVFGLAERSGNRAFNSAVVVSRGRYYGTYRKLHLFYKEKLWFSPGNRGLKVFEVDGYRLGVMVCYDWVYPEVARVLALSGADIIAHPSNLVLPGYCQKAMLARSFENRVYTITANRVGVERRGSDEFRYTGQSQIVTPRMEILASAGPDEVTAKSAEIDLSVSRDKKMTQLNDLIEDRRPRFYAALVSKRKVG